jgi:hypothetical protein
VRPRTTSRDWLLGALAMGMRELAGVQAGLQPPQGRGGAGVLDLATGNERRRVGERNPLNPLGLEIGFRRSAM